MGVTMNLLRFIIIIFLLISTIFLSCNDDEKDPIEFAIIGGGLFEGWYRINSGIPIGFGSDNLYLIAGGQYFFGGELDDVEKIEISATRIDYRDTLNLSITKDDVTVKEVILDADTVQSNATMTIELEYEYGETSTTTTTTDDDDSN